jgi:hypothetical protein
MSSEEKPDDSNTMVRIAIIAFALVELAIVGVIVFTTLSRRT